MRAVVVGAGAYGLSCAARMAEAGAEVLVLERETPAHAWAASGGLSRVLRFEYGPDARFTELTVRAVERWRALEAASAEELLVACGVLHLAADQGEWERASLVAVREAGQSIEELDAAEVARRWPAFAVADVGYALFSPAGGYLHARRATTRLAEQARAAGAEIRPATVAAVEDGEVVLAGGGRERADVVVLCTGSWSSAVDGRLAPIVPRRQVTAYFEGAPELPVFGDVGLEFYGFPASELGVKVGWHQIEHAEIADPSDASRREAHASDLEPLRGFLARRLPGLAAAPVTLAEVCYYAMTADEHPIVDRLDPRTVVCAGLSGHGFKYAPVLGRAAGELALGLDPTVDLAGFELGRGALLAD